MDKKVKMCGEKFLTTDRKEVHRFTENVLVGTLTTSANPPLTRADAFYFLNHADARILDPMNVKSVDEFMNTENSLHSEIMGEAAKLAA